MFEDRKTKITEVEVVAPNGQNIIVIRIEALEYLQFNKLESDKLENKPLNSLFYEKRHGI